MSLSAEDKVRAYIAEFKPRCYDTEGGMGRRTAFQEIEDLLNTSRSEGPTVAAPSGVYHEPEIEEDDDGTITLRAFSPDERSCVSYTILPDRVQVTRSDLDGKTTSERLNRIHAAPSGGSELRERVKRELLDFRTEAVNDENAAALAEHYASRILRELPPSDEVGK